MSERPNSIRYAGLLALPLVLMVGCSEPAVPVPDASGPTFANNAMAVGYQFNNATPAYEATLWGVKFTQTPVGITTTKLPSGTSATASAEVGSTVYAVGFNSPANNAAVGAAPVAMNPPDPAAGTAALLWQINASTGAVGASPTTLSIGATANATSLAVSGTTLFVGGADTQATKTLPSATVWNYNTGTAASTPVYLSDGTTASGVTAVAVDGTMVYAVGYTGTTPMLWSFDSSQASPVVVATADNVEADAGSIFQAVAVYNHMVYISGTSGSYNIDTMLIQGSSTALSGTEWTVDPTAPVFTAINLNDDTNGYNGAPALTVFGSNLIVGGFSVYGNPSNSNTQISIADLTLAGPVNFDNFTVYWPTSGYSASLVSQLSYSSTAIYGAGVTGSEVNKTPVVMFGVATVWMNQDNPVITPNGAATLLTDGTMDAAANAITPLK